MKPPDQFCVPLKQLIAAQEKENVMHTFVGFFLFSQIKFVVVIRSVETILELTIQFWNGR